MLKYHIKMDFCDDYSRLVKYWMQKQGLQSDKDGWDLWYEYFNFQKKNIVPQKRKVWKSKEFSCPQEFEKGLGMLIQRFEQGKDISMYLSKMAQNPSKGDDLLYDWGIYHFHLGEKIDSKTGYCERTGPLLFAKVDDMNVYLINVYRHGAWTKQEMLKIIYNNWPNIIERYRIPEVVRVTEKPSDSEYAEIRKAHRSIFLEVEENAVYWAPGGGYMASGHSIEITRHCDRIYNGLKEFEFDIKTKRFHDVIRYIEMCTRTELGNELHFMLWEEKNELYIVELHSKIALTKLTF